MRKIWKTFFVLLLGGAALPLFAQDTSSLSVNAYIDAYYSYNNNEPATSVIPYLVSSNRHNDFSINLAMLDVEYTGNRVRGRFAPGFGSYMNANYAAETGSFRNIVEASAGVKLSKKKEVWLDAGVMGAPFSYENAISKNQLVYSRSLAAEGSPYYVTGVKLTAPLAKNFTGALYVVNGWQQITDVNNQKSLIGHLEFHPENVSMNLSAYYGNEQNIVNTSFRERFLADFNIVYKESKSVPFSFSMGGYYGSQAILVSPSNTQNFDWWQANLALKYTFNNKIAISGRFEHFNDEDEIIYTSTVVSPNFNMSSVTLGGSYAITDDALFRLEARGFLGENNAFTTSNNGSDRTSAIVWTSLAVNIGHKFKFVKSPSTSTN